MRLLGFLVELIGGVLDAPLSTRTGSSEVRPASITYYLGDEEAS